MPNARGATRPIRQAAAAMAVVAVAGLVGLSPRPAAAADTCTIKIAHIVPMTGVLALLGKMTPWVIAHKLQVIEQSGGLQVGDHKCTVDAKIYDTKSTIAGSGEAATQAILNDKVDLVIAQGAPETTNAPSDLCERYNVPCVTTTTAIEAWLFGPDGKPKTYKSSFAFFLSVPDLVKNDIGMMKTLPHFNGKIGYLYPSNSDGTVFFSIFDPAFKAEGWTPVDPGRFNAGLPDYSALINTFKRQRVEIVAGILDPPDLQNYLQQAAQSGFHPRMTVISKGTGYADAIAAIGEPATGVLGVNFWSPAFPGVSAYGGWTGQQFADAYEKANPPAYYSPAGPYDDAAYDVVFDAIKRAGTLDKAAVIQAIASTAINTIVGPIKFNVQHYSVQPLGMGQWHQDPVSKRWIKENVYNAVYPSVKKTADFNPGPQP